MSSGFSFKPTSSSTQFSQERVHRKVVLKHSINLNPKVAKYARPLDGGLVKEYLSRIWGHKMPITLHVLIGEQVWPGGLSVLDDSLSRQY